VVRGGDVCVMCVSLAQSLPRGSGVEGILL